MQVDGRFRYAGRGRSRSSKALWPALSGKIFPTIEPLPNHLAPRQMVSLLRGRKLRPHQVFINFPQFGAQGVIINFDAIDMRPAKSFRGSEAMRASDQHRDASSQMPVQHHLINNANSYRLLQPDFLAAR